MILILTAIISQRMISMLSFYESQLYYLRDCLRHATRTIMANLIVRNVDEEIANALKVQASQHGTSAEAEHRRILEQALLRPKKKTVS